MIGNVLRIRYQLVQLLYDTPIFRVFAAQDKEASREVSVRVLRERYAGDEKFVAALRDAVRSVSAVIHPGLDSLYEVDTDDDATFIVGELAKGMSLAEKLKKLATFSVPAALEVAISVGEALEALHKAGLAAGDITSNSILVKSDGETKLLNAGLWPAYFENSQARQAVLDAFGPYIAPEISKGSLPNPTTDIYSLGVVLFEALTGRHPYRANDPVALALHHATEPVPSAKELNPAIPQALDQLIKKALAKSPRDRYADAGEMLADLRAIQQALRFGKPVPEVAVITAPLDQSAPAKAVAPAPAPKPVREPKPAPPPPPERDGSELPGWIKAIFIFLLGVVFVIVVYFLMANSQTGKSIAVPNLVGMSLDQAQSKVGAAHLSIRQSRQVASDQIAAGTIISTDPPAGAQVFEGRQIDAVVSSGSRFVEVPDLRGMTQDKAKSVLEKAGFGLDSSIDQQPDRNIPIGEITDQVPPPGQKYAKGTKVRITVSSGRALRSTSSDQNIKYVYTLHIHLTDLQQPATVRIDMTDSRGTKTIREESRNPGETYDVSAEGYGSPVTFRIFYNGELVKQVEASADNAENSDSTDNSDSDQL